MIFGVKKMNLVKSGYNGNADKLYVAIFGDLHYGHKNYNEKIVDEQLYFVKQHRDHCRILLLGDLVECATKTSVGKGTFDESVSLDDQKNYIEDKFKPYIELIDGAVGGNHEERVAQFCSLDLTEIFCKTWGKPEIYLGYRGFVTFAWNKQAYTFDIWHGATGGVTDGGALTALLNMAKVSYSDVHLMGHTHKKIDVTKPIYFPDSRNGKAVLINSLFVNTGCTMDNGGYGEMKGYAPLDIGLPIIELSGIRGNKSAKVIWL